MVALRRVNELSVITQRTPLGNISDGILNKY